jgi:hypothetical protein
MLDVVVARLPAAAARARPLAMGFLDALGALGSLHIVGGVVAPDSTVLWAANALALPLPGSTSRSGSTSRCSPRRWRASSSWRRSCYRRAPGFSAPGRPAASWRSTSSGCQDMAVGFSLLTWVVEMLVIVPLGGYFASREDVAWRQLVRGGAPAPAAEGGS